MLVTQNVDARLRPRRDLIGLQIRQAVKHKDGRIGRIALNRPEVMNAIDDDLPVELAAAVAEADADPGVHVMVLSGNGPAFCAGYDLVYYAEKQGGNTVVQDMPWDPIQDYAFM